MNHFNPFPMETIPWAAFAASACLILLVAVNISAYHRFLPMLLGFAPAPRQQSDHRSHEDDHVLPLYTVLVPLYQEGAVVKETVASLYKLNYPIDKLQIILLVEESDQDTLMALPTLAPNITLLKIPTFNPRGKARSLNCGLSLARGEFLTVFDAEDAPDPWQLRKAVAAFRDGGEQLWALQARLSYNNPCDNWLTRLFSAEYEFWYNHYLPYLFHHGYPVPLGGSSNHIRTKHLRALNGWSEYNVTEDAELSVRVHRAGGKIALLESVTMERSPTRIGTWIRQRTRWIKGLLQTTLTHAVHIRSKKEVGFFVFCYSGALLVLFMLALTLIYASFPANSLRLPLCLLGLLAFLLNFMLTSIIYDKMMHSQRIQMHFLALCPAVLFYWGLYCYANLRAIYQLITNPYLWEKTDHHPNA